MKYGISWVENASYSVEVEAESEQEAIKIWEVMDLSGLKPNNTEIKGYFEVFEHDELNNE